MIIDDCLLLLLCQYIN